MQLTAEELGAMLLQARAAAHRDAADIIEGMMMDDGRVVPPGMRANDALGMVVSMLRKSAAGPRLKVPFGSKSLTGLTDKELEDLRRDQ